MRYFVSLLLWLLSIGIPISIYAGSTASTTLTLSICGNLIVDPGEQCDVLGETGAYSQTIVGRQCTAQCNYGPYCGDGILQTIHAEECDDGNNENGDFCSALCKIEPAGSGGGGTSGGNSSGGGGSSVKLNNTMISVKGKAYPSRTINFLRDTVAIGTVRSDNSGNFEFSAESTPGTATLGIWATDSANNRSITLNKTFDVTQGAITNIKGIVLPPTLVVVNQKVNPGALVAVSGQSVPNSTVELHVDKSVLVEKTTSGANGNWTINFDTSKVSIAEHILRARTIVGTPPLATESSFSNSLQLFVGVDGKLTTPSDLNRDGSVNLIDFSILIFWWGTNGGDSNPPADINANGKVGLEDFSILLFNWTG